MDKFCMIVDSDNRAKIYINEKEIPDVCEIYIHGEPQEYEIEITQNAKDDNGKLIVENDMIKKVTTTYEIKGARTWK